MTSINNEPTNLVRYPLATAGRRLGAKIIDILLIGIVFTAIALAIFATDPNFKWNEIVDIQQWRYLLVGFFMISLFVGLLYILPLFTNWTIGMKLFKLKYVHILPLSKKALNLFKHEILIWGIMSIISLILCILLACLNKSGQAQSLLLGISQTRDMSKVKFQSLYYVGVAFACMYYCAALVLIVIIIGLFVRNKKPTFYDKFSNVVVIYLSPINDPDKLHNKKKTPNKKINFGVPGEISNGAFEELDDLE